MGGVIMGSMEGWLALAVGCLPAWHVIRRLISLKKCPYTYTLSAYRSARIFVLMALISAALLYFYFSGMAKILPWFFAVAGIFYGVVSFTGAVWVANENGKKVVYTAGDARFGIFQNLPLFIGFTYVFAQSLVTQS